MKINNNLIKIYNNPLSALEQKVLIAILDIINKNGDVDVYTLDIKKICDDLKNKYRFSQITKAFISIRRKPLYFEKIIDDDVYCRDTNFIIDAWWKKRGRYIDFEVHKKIKEIATKSAYYTHLELKSIYNLKSKYSVIFYLIAKQYINYNSMKYELEKFKSFFGWENQYKNKNNLKQKLKKIADEINYKTDIKVNFIFSKLKNIEYIKTDCVFKNKEKKEFEKRNINIQKASINNIITNEKKNNQNINQNTKKELFEENKVKKQNELDKFVAERDKYIIDMKKKGIYKHYFDIVDKKYPKNFLRLPQIIDTEIMQLHQKENGKKINTKD